MPPVLCGGSGASEPGPWTLLSALAGGVLRGPGLRAWDGVACSGLAWGAELPGAWVGGAGPRNIRRSRGTRRLIDLETHRDVFTWIQERLAQTGLLSGKTIAIDATTLEANAAMRSIVRRDTGETYQEFLKRLAKASGIRTPSRQALARLDRRRKKKGSNEEWKSPADPDAKIAKMKDGRTHLAHKTEQAVDLTTGAIVSVTVQGANQGDTSTLGKTLKDAETLRSSAFQKRTRACHPGGLQEVVGDKGYHSTAVLQELDAAGLRAYISEPDRGRRRWRGDTESRGLVYANRRRSGGARGQRLHRLRGERVERPFAHLYRTGRMRRTHLRGHENILKRVLVHSGAFNLGLLMRQIVGVGTPRGLQGRLHDLLAQLLHLWNRLTAITTGSYQPRTALAQCPPLSSVALHRRLGRALTTDC